MNHNLQIIPIPAFKDNYIWLIHNGVQAAAVDPGDSAPIIDALIKLNLTLTNILITHHHHDHIGGVAKLLEEFPQVNVYAPALEEYAFHHVAITEQSTVHLNDLNITFCILDLPGHTLGHIAYYSKQHQLLFCGDTLFGAGCGRLFEGTPTQMFHSLQKLAALPPATHVYCTHEYTMQNINFALTLEPNNQTLIERCKKTKKLLDENLPSLPTTIALELASNPFLRCYSQEIHASVGLDNVSELDTFSKIRELRNHY